MTNPTAPDDVGQIDFAQALAAYLESELALAQAHLDCTRELLALPVFNHENGKD